MPSRETAEKRAVYAIRISQGCVIVVYSNEALEIAY
jgi:hypothetical protein